MGLLDLPPELFEIVIHEFVTSTGVGEVWGCRAVCRTFKNQIEYDTWALQPLSRFARAEDERNFACKFIDRILYHHAQRPLDGECFLPKRIAKILDIIVKDTEGDELNESEIRRAIGRKITTSIKDTLPNWKLHKILSDKINSQNTPLYWETFAALTAVGEITLALKVLPLVEDGVVWSTELFGKPLVHMVFRSSTAQFKTLLDLYAKNLQHGVLGESESVKSAFCSALRAAVKQNNVEKCKILTDWQVTSTLWFQDYSEFSFLKYVLEKGTLEVVEVTMTLLKCLPYPGFIFNAFTMACGQGRTDVIPLLVAKLPEGVDKIYPWLDDNTPLLWAIRRSNRKSVEAILDAGGSADGPEAEDELIESPLQAAITCGNEEAVQLLIERGASVQPRRWIFETSFSRRRWIELVDPLHYARHIFFADIYDLIRVAREKEEGIRYPYEDFWTGPSV